MCKLITSCLAEHDPNLQISNYNYKKVNFYLYAPIAMRRERPQSYPDILRTNDTKVFSRGDAAFADYSINIGMGYRF